MLRAKVRYIMKEIEDRVKEKTEDLQKKMKEREPINSREVSPVGASATSVGDQGIEP